jgi:hypothetical protein
MEELMEVSDEGVAILDAVFPESLDIAVDIQPDVFLSAFAYFMKRDKKLPAGLRELSPAKIRKLQNAFSHSILRYLIR